MIPNRIQQKYNKNLNTYEEEDVDELHYEDVPETTFPYKGGVMATYKGAVMDEQPSNSRKFELVQKSARLMQLYVKFAIKKKENEVNGIFDSIERYFDKEETVEFYTERTVENKDVFEIYATVIKPTEQARIKLQAFEFDGDNNDIGVEFINVGGSAYICMEMYLQLVGIFKANEKITVIDDHNDNEDIFLNSASDADEEFSESEFWDNSSEVEEQDTTEPDSEPENIYLDFTRDTPLLGRFIQDFKNIDHDAQIEALVLVSHNIKSEDNWKLIQEKYSKDLADGLIYILDEMSTKKVVVYMAIRLAVEILKTIVEEHDETSFLEDYGLTEKKFEQYEAVWEEHQKHENINGFWKTGTAVEDCFQKIISECF